MALRISIPLYLNISTKSAHQGAHQTHSSAVQTAPSQGAYKVTEEELVIHSLRALKVCTRYFSGPQLPLKSVSTGWGQFENPASRESGSYGEVAQTTADLQALPAQLCRQDPPAAAELPHCWAIRGSSTGNPTNTFWQQCCTCKNFARTDLPGRGAIFFYASLTRTAVSREMQSLNPAFENEHEILKPGRKHRNHAPPLAKSTVHLLCSN